MTVSYNLNKRIIKELKIKCHSFSDRIGHQFDDFLEIIKKIENIKLTASVRPVYFSNYKNSTSGFMGKISKYYIKPCCWSVTSYIT
jgi:hypothetical protein